MRFTHPPNAIAYYRFDIVLLKSRYVILVFLRLDYPKDNLKRKKDVGACFF